jgi:hypothetical protein
MLTIKKIPYPQPDPHQQDEFGGDVNLVSVTKNQQFPQADVNGLGLTGFELNYADDFNGPVDKHFGFATADAVMGDPHLDPQHPNQNLVPVTCTIGLRDEDWGNGFLFKMSYALIGYTSDELATPILISPADQQQFSNHPRTTTLTWHPVPHATEYKVVLAWQDVASKVWYSYQRIMSGTSWTFEFVGDVPGRWCVTALDSTGKYTSSTNSELRYFTYVADIPVEKLATPILVSPADGQIFYSRKATLNWQAVAEATGYQVDVDYYIPSIWKSLKHQRVSGTSWEFTFGRVTTYRWRVTALDDTGAHPASEPSPWWELAFETTDLQEKSD